MQLLNKRPESLTDAPMHYCPGCGHGIFHRVTKRHSVFAAMIGDHQQGKPAGVQSVCLLVSHKVGKA